MPLLTCTQSQLMSALRAAAMVEAMMTDEDWLRRFNYTQNWMPGIDMASFCNGSGDDMYVIAGLSGVIIKGFDHESEVSPYGRDDHSPWPGIFEGVPHNLLSYIEDPSINKDDITFLHWLPSDSQRWCRGSVVLPDGITDGSDWMLSAIPLTAEDYIRDADVYFDGVTSKVPIAVIKEYFG